MKPEKGKDHQGPPTPSPSPLQSRPLRTVVLKVQSTKQQNQHSGTCDIGKFLSPTRSTRVRNSDGPAICVLTSLSYDSDECYSLGPMAQITNEFLPMFSQAEETLLREDRGECCISPRLSSYFILVVCRDFCLSLYFHEGFPR